MKLTNPQMKLLHEVAGASPGRLNVDAGYKPVLTLLTNKLVTAHPGRYGGFYLEITPAGRAALAAREEKK